MRTFRVGLLLLLLLYGLLETPFALLLLQLLLAVCVVLAVHSLMLSFVDAGYWVGTIGTIYW